MEKNTKYPGLKDGKTFWDIGQFEASIKRIDAGRQSLKDFQTMTKERAVIERNYADKIKSWKDKWTNHVKNGSEFGDIEKSWLSVLNEGQLVADIHFQISSALGLSSDEGIQRKIQDFKKSRYRKINPLPLPAQFIELRESKEAKEAFKNIQSTFKKELENIEKLKKKYREASGSLQAAKRKFEGTPSLVTKSSLLDSKGNTQTTQEAKDKAKLKYQEAIKSLHDQHKHPYILGMTKEFKKCQDLEKDRMGSLLNGLHSFIEAVNLTTKIKYPIASIYQDAVRVLTQANPTLNLSYWAQNYGSDMSHSFPVYKESDPQVDEGISGLFIVPASTSRRDSSRDSATQLHPTFTKQNSAGMISQNLGFSNKDQIQYTGAQSLPATDVTLEDRDLIPGVETPRANQSLETGVSILLSEDGSGYNNVYVRAVREFTSKEIGHLEFKQGEIIYQIRSDETSWCYGRIASREGKYPAKCVQLLRMDIFVI